MSLVLTLRDGSWRRLQPLLPPSGHSLKTVLDSVGQRQAVASRQRSGNVHFEVSGKKKDNIRMRPEKCRHTKRTESCFDSILINHIKNTKQQNNKINQSCGSGSGAFLTLDPGSGLGKKSGSGSEMNNPDHISESLETIFRV